MQLKYDNNLTPLKQKPLILQKALHHLYTLQYSSY